MVVKLILIFISFFAVIAAVKGHTWDDNEKGFRCVTKIGWFIIILAVLTVLFSSLKEYNENTAANLRQKDFKKMQKDLEEANIKALELKRMTLDVSNKNEMKFDELKKQSEKEQADLLGEIEKSRKKSENLNKELKRIQVSSKESQKQYKVLQLNFKKSQKQYKELQKVVSKTKEQYGNLRTAIASAFDSIEIHNNYLITRVKTDFAQLSIKKSTLAELYDTQEKFNEREKELLSIVNDLNKNFIEATEFSF